MRKLVSTLLITSLFLSTGYTTGVKPVNLKINIYNLHSSKGQIVVMLYNKDGSIPDKTFSKYYRKKIINIQEGKAFVEFNNLPPNKYAVNFFHDENANGELDKGFIKPKEGFGLSRFESVNLFNRPNFERAAINVQHDTLIRIKTIYL